MWRFNNPAASRLGFKTIKEMTFCDIIPSDGCRQDVRRFTSQPLAEIVKPSLAESPHDGQTLHRTILDCPQELQILKRKQSSLFKPSKSEVRCETAKSDMNPKTRRDKPPAGSEWLF